MHLLRNNLIPHFRPGMKDFVLLYAIVTMLVVEDHLMRFSRPLVHYPSICVSAQCGKSFLQTNNNNLRIVIKLISSLLTFMMWLQSILIHLVTHEWLARSSA